MRMLHTCMSQRTAIGKYRLRTGGAQHAHPISRLTAAHALTKCAGSRPEHETKYSGGGNFMKLTGNPVSVYEDGVLDVQLLNPDALLQTAPAPQPTLIRQLTAPPPAPPSLSEILAHIRHQNAGGASASQSASQQPIPQARMAPVRPRTSPAAGADLAMPSKPTPTAAAGVSPDPSVFGTTSMDPPTMFHRETTSLAQAAAVEGAAPAVSGGLRLGMPTAHALHLAPASPVGLMSSRPGTATASAYTVDTTAMTAPPGMLSEPRPTSDHTQLRFGGRRMQQSSQQQVICWCWIWDVQLHGPDACGYHRR